MTRNRICAKHSKKIRKIIASANDVLLSMFSRNWIVFMETWYTYVKNLWKKLSLSISLPYSYTGIERRKLLTQLVGVESTFRTMKKLANTHINWWALFSILEEVRRQETNIWRWFTEFHQQIPRSKHWHINIKMKQQNLNIYQETTM